MPFLFSAKSRVRDTIVIKPTWTLYLSIPCLIPSRTPSIISSLLISFPSAINAGLKRNSINFTPSKKASSTFSYAIRLMASYEHETFCMVSNASSTVATSCMGCVILVFFLSSLSSEIFISRLWCLVISIIVSWRIEPSRCRCSSTFGNFLNAEFLLLFI